MHQVQALRALIRDRERMAASIFALNKRLSTLQSMTPEKQEKSKYVSLPRACIPDKSCAAVSLN